MLTHTSSATFRQIGKVGVSIEANPHQLPHPFSMDELERRVFFAAASWLLQTNNSNAMAAALAASFADTEPVWPSAQSQKQKRNNQLIAQSIQKLAAANENSARTLAAAFREPASHSITTADTVSRTELNEKLDQIDERNRERLEALERRQEERQNELLRMLQAVVGGRREEGSGQ